MDNRERHYLNRFALHRPWVWFVAAMAVLAVVATVGLFVDDRTVGNAPIWAKPLKFALSFVLYGGALAVLLPMLEKGKRLGWWLGTVLVAGSAVEMVAIVGQAARGTASHFNNATDFDSTVYRVMGGTVAVIWTATLVVAVLLWRNRIGDRALSLTLRLSMLLALAGMGTGFLMTTPTAAQLAAEPVDVVGAHSVGVTDGGPGLPVIGWSTTGGDLRIAHFVGMHGLQLLPLIAMGLAVLARRRPGLAAQGNRVRLMAVLTAGYTGLFGLVLWQALRAEPVTSPSLPTLLVGALVVLVTVVGSVWALRPVPDRAAAHRSRPVPAA